LLLKHSAKLLLVPRHPQRFEEVRRLLTESGWSFVTRSSGAPITENVDVVLIDAMGELLTCYAASDFAYVGGSLVPVGGHNVLEPAALGVATLCGLHMSSAQEAVDRLLQAGGLMQVTSADALREAVLMLADNPAKRDDLGKQAQSVVAASRGAAAQTVRVVEAMLTNRTQGSEGQFAAAGKTR
jgi:3-deoxy-D-manno-octulosonic-acid transferase